MFVLGADSVLRGGVSLLNDVTLFERNPVNPAQYAVTDSSGLLYFTGIDGANAARIDQSPFSQFLPQSREENNAFVQDITWSPDGQFLAFLVNGDTLTNDGVWFFGPGQFAPLQLLVDCPNNGHPGCQIVISPDGPDRWESLALDWSPTGDSLLVRTWIPTENRAGLTVLPITRNERARDVRPPVYRYAYGSWENNGNRLLVSGSGPDGNVYIGWVNRDGSFSELILAARDAGLWVQNAVQRPDGSIVTLGAPTAAGGRNTAQRIYDASGQALTGPIGSEPPQRVEWSPDRSAVLVVADNRIYLANINGSVTDITAEVAGTRAINWVAGNVPTTDQTAPSQSSAPNNASVNSQADGERWRVLAPDGLNIRSAPSTTAEIVGYVGTEAIVLTVGSPPVRENGLIWWEIRTETTAITGWIAGEINGQATIGQ